MNPLTLAAFVAIIACTQASVIGLGVLNPAAHIASGSVSVGVNGAVVAGPAGSVRTDNGLAGLGAGAQLSGPAGDVRTRGGAVALNGPGLGGLGVGVAGPVGVVGGLGRVGVVGPVGLGGVVGPVGLGGLGLGGVGLGGVGLGGVGLGLGGLGLGLGGLGHL